MVGRIGGLSAGEVKRGSVPPKKRRQVTYGLADSLQRYRHVVMAIGSGCAIYLCNKQANITGF